MAERAGLAVGGGGDVAEWQGLRIGADDDAYGSFEADVEEHVLHVSDEQRRGRVGWAALSVALLTLASVVAATGANFAPQ
jgi:hypothetical protein